MDYLKYHSLIISHQIKYKYYYTDYFKDIYIAKNNRDALKIYYETQASVLFLDCNEEKPNTLNLIQEIRKIDHNIIIAIFTEKLDKEKLLQALPLKLISCLCEPIENHSIETLLKNINKELASMVNKKIYFLNGYSFEFKTHDIYDSKYNKIHLTKNEKLLMEFLLKNKNHWVKNDVLAAYIWGNSFYEHDCAGRMKVLLCSIRKKLSKDIIRNSYGLGYMVETVS